LFIDVPTKLLAVFAISPLENLLVLGNLLQNQHESLLDSLPDSIIDSLLDV